jgi:hypothetical protein
MIGELITTYRRCSDEQIASRRNIGGACEGVEPVAVPPHARRVTMAVSVHTGVTARAVGGCVAIYSLAVLAASLDGLA